MPGISYAIRYPDLHGQGGAAFLAGTGHGGGVRRDAFLEAAWMFERIQAEVLCELYNNPPGPKFGPGEVVLVHTLPSGRREVSAPRRLSFKARELVSKLVGDTLTKGTGDDSRAEPSG